MITLDLYSPQPPAVVLAALRAHGGEWRQSCIPAELWRAGISAVECRVRGATCTLTYRRQWYGTGARGQLLRAQAMVIPAARGTQVRVSVQHHVPGLTLLAMGVGFGTLVGVVVVGGGALLFLLFALGVVGLQYGWMRIASCTLSRTNDPAADYLVHRIEEAVAGAGDVRPPAPAS